MNIKTIHNENKVRVTTSRQQYAYTHSLSKRPSKTLETYHFPKKIISH